MSIFAKLHNLARSYVSLSKTNLEKIDLTVTQAKILSVLANNDKKMIQRELGQKAYLKAASTSRMIDTLEEKGLVARDNNPKSRRSFKISITDKGLKKYALSVKIFKNAEDELFGRLSVNERNLFSNLIDKITKGDQSND